MRGVRQRVVTLQLLRQIVAVPRHRRLQRSHLPFRVGVVNRGVNYGAVARGQPLGVVAQVEFESKV